MSQAGSVSTGGGGGGNLDTLTPDTGGPVSPLAGTIQVLGTGGITTSNGGSNILNINAPSSLLQSNQVTLTSAEIKNLVAVPQTIVPAQGAGTVIIPYFVTAKLNYGGTTPFTTGGNINLSYSDGISFFLLITGFIGDPLIIATEDSYEPAILATGSPVIFTPSQIENIPVVFENSLGSDWGGNAANDNTVVISTQYVVLTL